ncbi:tRNA preQ1(34) S-adenosylmethionine ribosyltransferase-isomerase QueA [Candidatus Viadribacter manganicus]|uniref:S-adenosylmethionine:tRNA ribosyltransferase-isomerase n=1 Tax=Candidatus Viadribacter manganicus TaxID=1759059 RepID=A0A1B1ADL9_9PROT|nr:tRNA preQ1(34) S-adenosylmethionine ribosyltransferase-isomerase QueA [Candidatus Viadribacter manganicus]ANP44658.1 S-adenosylmethionine:tRNA ribosyltransferase-isomerase [Candidatus Viadribacter manganicus]
MRVDLFDFELPDELVALRPARPRESARLLHVPKAGPFEDLKVGDATTLFRAGDLLVFNDTRVIPAALKAIRPSRDPQGPVVNVSLNLIERMSPDTWRALGKPGKRLKQGDGLFFDEGLFAAIEGKSEEGELTLRFDRSGAELDQAIAQIGAPPLPPYIAGKRAPDDQDRADYQTIYAARDGAVAAPTAGLHFTQELLSKFSEMGVERTHVTLHVGAGTFLPVKVEDTSAHVMHSEWREISLEAAASINRARREGRRVIAIGTTALRSLESAADEDGKVRAEAGGTNIFIAPGYRFRVIDCLWTNFHLPRSTLFMLVSAFAGFERMQAAYKHAIDSGYRFYSYGDASLLWRAE